MRGVVVWFTGLSGAGKSTLSKMLVGHLQAVGVPHQLFDGDSIRARHDPRLGFSRRDRDANVRRIGALAREAIVADKCAIVAAMSPYRAARDAVRAAVPRFCEVYCRCTPAELERRDPKGLYARFRRGEIEDLSGFDAPYEAPAPPDILLDTTERDPKASFDQLLEALRRDWGLPDSIDHRPS